MPKQSKGSAAKRVGQKVHKQKEEYRQTSPEAPLPIAGERGWGTRVEPHGEGLTLVLPRVGEPTREDLSFLQQVPRLMPMLSEGIRLWAEGNLAERTRESYINDLKNHFIHYISSSFSHTLTSKDLIDDALWAGFVDFLNQPGQNGEPIALGSRAKSLYAIRCTLKALRTNTNWADLADNILEHVPKNPWPGVKRKKNPVPVLPIDQFDAIILAADAEFAQLRERRDEGERLLSEGRERLATGARNFRQDKALCLAALEARSPDILPSKVEINAEDPSLGYAVKVHGLNVLARYLYLSARDLVPLVLLLAARTSFNPGVILSLCWSDLSRRKTVDGREAVRFAAYKPRSDSEQVKWLDLEAEVPDGLGGLLDLIKAMTVRLRPRVPPDHTDRLFVFMPENKSRTPKGFGHNKRDSNDDAWKWALNRFIQDHNFQAFSLQQFRPTRGSEIFEATGDIMASSKELGHRSTQTTWTHYTSDAVQRRQIERIGQVHLVRERWLATNGQIDPRGDKPDPGAATPGFLCLNPHDSPRQGQVKGRPCRAYGECAACPLAGVQNEVTPVAQYLAVRQAIINGQYTMAPQTWVAKWAPILAEHEAMLEALDPEVVARAQQIKLSYPAVG